MRSLQRRLRERGTTWSAVLDGVRYRAAVELMTSQPLPLDQVAARLGFGGSPALHRAFQRWTGSSPRAFQRGELARSTLAMVGRQKDVGPACLRGPGR
ncbi:MAG: AraC family transcriptional regulator [Myxococcales bacterium]|nr:AraC family transcriptional regulator [Myxococcales bacterium]